MVSAAEQLAANINFGALTKAKELHKRLLFTVVALIVYRLGTFIPIPGIDPEGLRSILEQTQGGLLGMFNALGGGAVERMAIFALNIMPYISASIILQVMTIASPTLEQLKKEGEAGRKKINQYTRYLTVALAAVQAYAIAMSLSSQANIVPNPGLFFTISTVVTLTGGTMFLMWLGEQITARGVGNGVSLIIFAGIVANLPQAVATLFSLGAKGTLPAWIVISVIIGTGALVAGIVYLERAQRRLIIQYPKRQVGNRMFQGEKSHLPLKINPSGVIPPIFASSLLLLPMTAAQFTGTGGPDWLRTVTALLGPNQPLFYVLYAAGIIFFTFFYTSIVFNPEDTADNLKKYGGFIPGIRPGKRTADYIDYVLTRLTVVGALYLTVVCIVPQYGMQQMGLPFALGGTSILIVVSVTMDTVAQIHSHLLAHQYEGLIKKARLRGARTR